MILAPITLAIAPQEKAYASETVNIKTNSENITYEESQNLPYADLSTDLNSVSSDISTFSIKSQSSQLNANSSSIKPISIAGFKKLGYKNIEYTKWTGYKKVVSTKSKRIASLVATNILGFVPSKYVQAAVFLYDVSSTVKTQYQDIWPTVSTRNILATSPRGLEVIIGQETIVKYYGNSARTKLLKTIPKTYWIN